jgi:outer membrane protein OmpA-like peptidoglycan-associated protein
MLRFLLVFIFRLLLVAVGGGLAALAGVAIAIRSPNPTPEKPLIAHLLPSLDPEVAASNPAASPTEATETATPVQSTSQLGAAEQEKLEAELKQLEAKLKKLPNRRANRQKIAQLNQQIAEIEQQLHPEPPPVASTPFFSPDQKTATLPSDALFADTSGDLRPEAGPILDKIARELKNYPKTTVRIWAHTDGAGQARNNRILSFRQAQAIAQYLSSALGDGYHWLVVGYGETRPLVPNDTPVNLQRNRRIEIAVE